MCSNGVMSNFFPLLLLCATINWKLISHLFPNFRSCTTDNPTFAKAIFSFIIINLKISNRTTYYTLNFFFKFEAFLASSKHWDRMRKHRGNCVNIRKLNFSLSNIMYTRMVLVPCTERTQHVHTNGWRPGSGRHSFAGILRDKTMDDIFIYIPNNVKNIRRSRYYFFGWKVWILLVWNQPFKRTQRFWANFFILLLASMPLNNIHIFFVGGVIF